MVTDLELIERLNLPRTSPSSVLKENSRSGEIEAIQISEIPKDRALYWVAGVSVLATGRKISSVFRVSNGGGGLVDVYWFIDGAWYASGDADAPAALGAVRDDVIPFDWAYAVPVANDIYHDDVPSPKITAPPPLAWWCAAPMPAIGVAVGTMIASELARDVGGLLVLGVLIFWWFVGALGGILVGALVATVLTARRYGVAKCWQWLIRYRP